MDLSLNPPTQYPVITTNSTITFSPTYLSIINNISNNTIAISPSVMGLIIGIFITFCCFGILTIYVVYNYNNNENEYNHSSIVENNALKQIQLSNLRNEPGQNLHKKNVEQIEIVYMGEKDEEISKTNSTNSSVMYNNNNNNNNNNTNKNNNNNNHRKIITYLQTPKTTANQPRELSKSQSTTLSFGLHGDTTLQNNTIKKPQVGETPIKNNNKKSIKNNKTNNSKKTIDGMDINAVEKYVKEWNTNDVKLWLENNLLLPEYSNKFLKNKVDGELLVKMNESRLKEMEIIDKNHRVKILIQVQELKD